MVRRVLRKLRIGALLATLALVAAGIALSTVRASTTRGNGLQVVAAENFWGSIASQLGGDRVRVTSVIASPATDPHDYEPTAGDARTVAGAKLAIVNGIGYDPWAGKLLAASPAKGRIVLTVGDLVGVKPGRNTHRWYSPSDVQQGIAAIVGDYKRLDPNDAGYGDRQKGAFESK